MQELVVLVDQNDKKIGIEEKLKAHQEGELHRVFSIFIFNPQKQLLLQRRSLSKYHSAGLWTNTCCSHPRESEGYEEAGQRRLEEELGFTCILKYIGKFQYQANYKDIGAENELCSVLVGEYDGEVNVDPKEANSFKWVDFKELKKDVLGNPDKYTPWFKIELDKFFK